MTPESLLSYYPTYSILDEVVCSTECNTLNIYIDLKNNLQTLYMKEPVLNLIENSLNSRFIDTSIFSSVLSFLEFHKKYSMKRPNLKVKFYIFFESGKSYYHLNISKKYKINRRIDELYGLDKEKRDYFFSILQKNYMLLDKVCNRIPNTKLFRIENLEADFIPFYLIRNNLVDNDERTSHIIYSNDHDLLQCLSLGSNVFIYRKNKREKKIIKNGESIKSYFKTVIDYPDDYLTLLMSIIGDVGDDVYGIKGIGPIKALEMIDDLLTFVGGIENLKDNIFYDKSIFNFLPSIIKNKYLSKVIDEELKFKTISNNMKLVDFELISRALDEPINTEMIKKRKSIIDVINQKDILPIQYLKPALEMNGVYLQDELEIIYM